MTLRWGGGAAFQDGRLVLICTFVVIIVCVMMFYESRYSELVYVRAQKYDPGRAFMVRNRYDKQTASDTLAYITTTLKALIDYVNSRHPEQQPGGKDMERRFNPDRVTESLSKSKYTSYSVNKGEEIVFCIRHKEPPQDFGDPNTLMFVAIHELAHLMTPSVGHTPEFWDNMRFLLRCAIKIQQYQFQNYRTQPQRYCGMTITDTPLVSE
jgi:hypothetical protein